MLPAPGVHGEVEPNQRLAGGLVAAGGLLATIAGLPGWAAITPADGGATTFSGLDLSAGVGSLACGVGLIIVAIFLFARSARTGGRGASIVAVVLGVVVVVVAGYSSVAPADALMEFQDNRVAGGFGMSNEVGRVLDLASARGPVDVTSLAGSWMAAVGGFLALGGGMAGLVRARRIRAKPPGADAEPFVPPPPGVL